MGRLETDSTTADNLDENFEPAIGESFEETYEAVSKLTPEQRRYTDMRRRAEQRLEKKRLQEELGYFDLELDGD
jgi:hypothetical protein